MLNASAACLGTTPDDSPALSEARKRLAEASSDLAAFFAATWRVKDLAEPVGLSSGNFAKFGPCRLGISEERGCRSQCSSSSATDGPHHHAISGESGVVSGGFQPQSFKPIISGDCSARHKRTWRTSHGHHAWGRSFATGPCGPPRPPWSCHGGRLAGQKRRAGGADHAQGGGPRSTDQVSLQQMIDSIQSLQGEKRSKRQLGHHFLIFSNVKSSDMQCSC